MAAEITLVNALDSLSSKTATVRRNGLNDLKHILRSNPNGTLARNLNNSSFLELYQALFQYAIDERSAMVKAKSQSTRSSSANRLTDIAATLRMSIEAGVQVIRVNTVTAVLDHVFETICHSSGDFCEPLAMDYAKCIHVLFRYQPHVEQLTKDWDHWTAHCIENLNRAATSFVEDSDAVSTTRSAFNLSVRSSRSHLSTSQESRFAAKQIAEEFVSCLQLLTAAPNAPITTKGADILQTLVGFLQTAGTTSRALPDAFTAVNQVLSWSRTNNIALTREITPLIIRIIRHSWSPRSSASTQMLVTLLLLRPYLFHALNVPTAFALKTDVTGVLHAMQNDYASRHERDRQRQLSPDDLRLHINVRNLDEDGNVGTTIFSLRCVGIKGETNWLLLYMMASLHHLLMANDSSVNDQTTELDESTTDHSDGRSRKRPRLQDHFADLIGSVESPQASVKICALQILAFLAQQKTLTLDEWARACDAAVSACGDENNNVASWGFLAVASCMSQAVAAEASFVSRCTSVWQLASRSLSSTNLCRAASYSLFLMLRLQLASKANISELVQTITEAMDLNGPSQLSDAACHLLNAILIAVRQVNGSASQTADSIVVWLSRTFTPAKMEDRNYANGALLYEPTDILALINGCLERNMHPHCTAGFRVWEAPARAWLLCRNQRSLVSYLLLNDDSDTTLHSALEDATPTPSTVAPASSAISTETLLLTHLNNELTRISNAWELLNIDRSRQISYDAYAMLCKASVVFNCTICCIPFRDVRRRSQVQQQSDNFLSTLSHFMSTANDDAKSDAYLMSASSTFAAFINIGNNLPHQPSSCERILCTGVANAISRQRNAQFVAVDLDSMDLEDQVDSQDSRQSQLTTHSLELLNDFDLSFSKAALRSNTALYTQVVTAVGEQKQQDRKLERLSAEMTSELIALSDFDLLASRNVIRILPKLGLSLGSQDIERLLDHFMEDIIRKYSFAKSEVALGAVLDIMTSQNLLWTNPTNESLFNLGIDVYKWFTETAVPAAFLSPDVQKRLAILLRSLCDIEHEYPSVDGAASVSYNLFMLLQQGDTTLQFNLAAEISSIFEGFTLSEHQIIFQDLVSKLPADFKWVEGIAMRLLFLSKLGASWHSLLRHCVYYIFETAGNNTDSLQHATHCIAQLSTNLPLKSPRKLFSLFAPQLLNTWQDNAMPLTKLPFAAFQYSSLADMLSANESEVCAQLATRGSSEDVDTVVKAIKVLPRDLYKRSFAKCYAYAINWDVAHGNSGEATVETRLREAVGGKSSTKSLILEHWPSIMGYLYLTLQQDDAENKWLQKREHYESVNHALAEIKGYSHSNRSLPQSQQPYARASSLPDRVGRIARRMGFQEIPWTSSTFTLTARMLVNAIDESLGSLHSCLMIRRLRMLISMTGPCAYQGFALEMLVHSLLPFIEDSECADDTIGLLQYLFHHGHTYLKLSLEAENIKNKTQFLGGTVILLLLRIRQYSQETHPRSTQGSQHMATVEKLKDFSRWLVKYFEDIMTKTGHSISMRTLAEDLALIGLPGNATKGSSESRLLLFLLEQWGWDENFCSKANTLEALKLLAHNFDAPSSVWIDCLGDDSTAWKYSQALWEVLRSTKLSDAFASWAAQALGRAYASTGTRPTRSLRQSAFVRFASENMQDNNIAVSEAIIAEKWSDLLFSRSRQEAGIAEHCLRTYMMTETPDAKATTAFVQMLPETTYEAVMDGTFGYVPSAGVQTKRLVDASALSRAFEHSSIASVEAWVAEISVSLCYWATTVPLISSLALMVQNVDGLAMRILPSILHILLVKELDQGSVLREILSRTVSSCLSERGSSFVPKQRFLLELLLYLRGQPYPGEVTTVDRLRWLDVDYIIAAEAGSRCGMATCALMLAESAPTRAQSIRRSSARNSQWELSPPLLSEDLLLSVYQQLEEPDSFYGVPQPASLESVLHRLDHEADGIKSLMFRSAQMDTHMRRGRQVPSIDAAGLIHSLWDLNFNSLTFSLLRNGLGTALPRSHELFSAAQALQQWDISVLDSTDSSPNFAVFQELSRAIDPLQTKQKFDLIIIDHISKGIEESRTDLLRHSWYSTLAGLTESAEILSCANHAEIEQRRRIMQGRNAWMHLAHYEEVKTVLSNRHTLFGVIRQNSSLRKMLRLDSKQCHALEAHALLHSSCLAREHSRLQDALVASTSLNDMTNEYLSVGLRIDAAIKEETACVLWNAGESTASVKMLRDVIDISDIGSQDIPVGKAGLHAQLARQLADARLEKPEEILSNYLKPAIIDLRSRNDKQEAGKVHYEFASFCDGEVSNPGNIENLARIAKLRQDKEEEVEAITLAIKNAKKTGADRQELHKSLIRAKQWVNIDSAEEERLRSGRRSFIHQSLQNYLLTLRYTDKYDICVLRFFALWLENADDEEANGTVSKYLSEVASWKFVLLMNQLMSRVAHEATLFQNALQELLLRIFKDHPHQSIHHLFASCQAASSHDPAAASRFSAAQRLFKDLRHDAACQQAVVSIWKADQYYRVLAEVTPELQPNVSRCRLRDIPSAHNVAAKIPGYSLPPVTLSIPLRPSGDYGDIPRVQSFDDKVMIMTGLSHPKVLTALDSTGNRHRQLFKGGNDDLRQDAIMEQVFEEVSKMLRNHKATRQRDLKVRTYRVIPLSTGSGIIEFVPNSVPINDYLKPAHKKYYPRDMLESKARELIRAVEKESQEQRVKQFRKICEQLHPVLRHFFFERFQDPDDWFEKRTAYARTTASISILGHILGLGDRHNSNILLDEKTGEIVHIDLGVAFEAGRVLPIPEKVPFRLTRDITDGMGPTKTEGVFRRCCEFTLDAVREDKESIMTLLNVLRYDPLYSWSISPLRAKRMQEAQEMSRNAGVEEVDSTKRREQEAGEADRALSIVEKKLSKALSTQAAVNELIQQATDETNLATLFAGWGAFW